MLVLVVYTSYGASPVNCGGCSWGVNLEEEYDNGNAINAYDHSISCTCENIRRAETLLVSLRWFPRRSYLLRGAAVSSGTAYSTGIGYCTGTAPNNTSLPSSALWTSSESGSNTLSKYPTETESYPCGHCSVTCLPDYQPNLSRGLTISAPLYG